MEGEPEVKKQLSFEDEFATLVMKHAQRKDVSEISILFLEYLTRCMENFDATMKKVIEKYEQKKSNTDGLQ